jgi:hypothetical protein
MRAEEKSRVGRRTSLVCAVVICGLAVSAGVASAKWSVFRAGNVILKFDGGLSPKSLPRHTLAPVAVFGRFQIATTDGTHVPAIRRGTFEGDRNFTINAAGLPTCRKGQLEAIDSANARRVCGDSIVGTGDSTVEIAFPEQQPILVDSPLTFFNGGIKGGTTTLFVHGFITVPVPVGVVTTVRFKRVDAGPYGLRLVSEVPEIAGGAGSILAADFRLRRSFRYMGKKRSYLMGKCPDGQFQFRIVSTEFDLEGLPASAAPTLSGNLIRPCSPRD